MAPDVSISTDIIVGFPGESDADFEETMKVVDEVQFEQMFSFKYSPRPMTEAAEYENAVKIGGFVVGGKTKEKAEKLNRILDEIMNMKREK